VLKVTLPFGLVFLGALGIISSWAIGAIASLIGGFIFIKMLPRLKISVPIIKKMFSFSAVNYICTFLALAPESILPLLITGKLNTSATAYYYIAWNITAILFVVPNAISRTLLAEDAKLLNQNLKKAIKFSTTLLVPAVIIVVLISKNLLLLFGTEYSTHAHRLLQLLAISSIPFAINTVYICVQNVKHNLRAVFTINIILSSSTIGLSYLLLERGIFYAGISWLISHSITACVVLIISVVRKSEHKI
jgi:O-antigen/teichoic acid export membrane protein